MNPTIDWIASDTLPDEPGLYWCVGVDYDGDPRVSLFEVEWVPAPSVHFGRAGFFGPCHRRTDTESPRWEHGLQLRRMTHYARCPRPEHPNTSHERI